MSKHKRYTSQQKFQIVKEGLASGTSITEICKRYSIHPNNFYNWQKIFFDSALEGFNKPKGRPCTREQKELEELKMSNQRMKDVIAEITAENIDLKKKL